MVSEHFGIVDCKPYVKNLVARRANEKPLHVTIFFLEHTMEAVLVTALGTDFKFLTRVHLMYLVIHLTNLQAKSGVRALWPLAMTLQVPEYGTPT